MGYHPLYMIARGLRRIISKPYVIGGLAMIITFFTDGWRGREQLPDPTVISYIRRTQLRQIGRFIARETKRIIPNKIKIDLKV
jgi:hypothetical protein